MDKSRPRGTWHEALSYRALADELRARRELPADVTIYSALTMLALRAAITSRQNECHKARA